MSDTAGRFQPNNLLIRCAKDLAAVLGAAVSGATDETSVTVDMSDCDRRLSATDEDRAEDGRGEDGRGGRVAFGVAAFFTGVLLRGFLAAADGGFGVELRGLLGGRLFVGAVGGRFAARGPGAGDIERRGAGIALGAAVICFGRIASAARTWRPREHLLQVL